MQYQKCEVKVNNLRGILKAVGLMSTFPELRNKHDVMDARNLPINGVIDLHVTEDPKGY